MATTKAGTTSADDPTDMSIEQMVTGLQTLVDAGRFESVDKAIAAANELLSEGISPQDAISYLSAGFHPGSRAPATAARAMPSKYAGLPNAINAWNWYAEKGYDEAQIELWLDDRISRGGNTKDSRSLITTDSPREKMHVPAARIAAN
jgi:hypothetical protein